MILLVLVEKGDFDDGNRVFGHWCTIDEALVFLQGESSII